jgi:hypothetical protein
MSNPAPAPPPCWICGDPATTAEHRLKRSDAKASFGVLTQARPGYLHSDAARNQKVQTLGSPLLSFKSPLCAPCNNERTQPHDRAWETLATALRAQRAALSEGAYMRANRIFCCGARRGMLNVHLFFVKLFLGMIVDGDAAFDRAAFSRAILSGTAHPNVYLKLGLFDGLNGRVVAGASNLEVDYYAADGRPAFAAWLYEPGSGIAVMVMYAADGEQRQGLDGAWHPKLSTTRLLISSFND